jgi:hypothetical protein
MAAMATLVGPLDSLTFPELCPACGARAAQALDIPKWFLRTYDAGDERVYAEVRVPFCARCVDQHERERARQPMVPAYRYPGLVDHFLPAMWLAMGLFFFSIAAGGVGKGMVFVGALGAIGLFFLWIGVATAVGAWRVPWHERVPPQTSVTRAFDYTDDESDVFEPPRRRYFIRNSAFEEQFVALNAARQWDPRGPEARRARRKWGIAIIVFILLLIAMMVWEPGMSAP